MPVPHAVQMGQTHDVLGSGMRSTGGLEGAVLPVLRVAERHAVASDIPGLQLEEFPEPCPGVQQEADDVAHEQRIKLDQAVAPWREGTMSKAMLIRGMSPSNGIVRW